MRHCSKFRKVPDFLILWLSCAALLLAQTGAGRIEGTVKDSSGAIMPNTRIIAEQIETGNRFETRTNESGFFVFPSAAIGRYRVRAEAPGMEPWQGELVLQTGQQAVVEPVLKVGGTTTEVVVAGDVTPMVTTTSPELANVVERKRIEELPLNGRMIQNLITITTPGVEDAGGSNRPQAFGLRDGTMEFLQDGVSLNDANLQTFAQRPPGLDTIQEFRVETSVGSAKYSRPVNTVMSTRNGTNQVHGALFYTGRNNGFGVARRREDYYDKPPQLIRNEYGASLGGPVDLPHIYEGKNRTFFFFAWEAFKLRNATTLTPSVPTAAMRQGDFSQLRDAQGRQLMLYDPWSTGSKANSYGRVPFVGNIIPARLESPLAAYVNSVTPLPTLTNVNPLVAANCFVPSPVRQNDSTGTLRLDHRLGDRDQIFGRYSRGYRDYLTRRANDTGQTPITSDKYWNIQATPETNDSAMVSWNHIFSPVFFVETVATGSRIYWSYNANVPSAQQNIGAQLGTPNPFNLNGAPAISNVGFNLNYVGVLPRDQDTRPIGGEQNYTFVHGKHQLEFGWRYRHMGLEVLPDRPASATLDFSSQATGLYDPATGNASNAFPRTGYDGANFFLGIAGLYRQILPTGMFNLSSNEVSGYLQDNWKITPRLTLNLGLRYEYLGPMLDKNGVNNVFDMKTRSIVRTASVADLIQRGYTTQEVVNAYQKIGVKFATPKEVGLPDSLVNVGQMNFSPRVGFAWEPKIGQHSLVVRGGYGQYRFALGARTFNSQRNNAPLQGTFDYNINSAALSPDGVANYGLRSTPTAIAGLSSANVIDINSPNAVGRGIAVNTFDSYLPTSVAHEWNLTLETEIMKNTLLRVGYVGTAGRNLDETQLINGQPGNYVWYVETGTALPTGQYASVARRSFDQTTYGNVNVYRKTGYSNYNGLQVMVQRRFSQGIAFQWFYVMSNALYTGSGGDLASTTVPDPAQFLPGAVPTDYNALNRFYNYRRDTDIPKHRIRWNFTMDLPFGHGKKLLANSGRLLNGIAGGWQLAAYSSLSSRYWALPADDWGYLGDVQAYGTKYKIQDCRSGACIPGYLYYNGYIPANQINARNAAGQCTGVCGVPADYKPSIMPIWPTPATGISSSDPNAAYYETNIVYVPMKNGSQQRIAYDNGLHPWRNQFIPGPWNWQVNSSLFKVIPIKERLRLRFNMDFFNVLNMPGLGLPNPSTGILSLQDSDNGPRLLQWTLRLTW